MWVEEGSRGSWGPRGVVGVRGGGQGDGLKPQVSELFGNKHTPDRVKGTNYTDFYSFIITTIITKPGF